MTSQKASSRLSATVLWLIFHRSVRGSPLLPHRAVRSPRQLRQEGPGPWIARQDADQDLPPCSLPCHELRACNKHTAGRVNTAELTSARLLTQEYTQGLTFIKVARVHGIQQLCAQLQSERSSQNKLLGSWGSFVSTVTYRCTYVPFLESRVLYFSFCLFASECSSATKADENHCVSENLKLYLEDAELLQKS